MKPFMLIFLALFVVVPVSAYSAQYGSIDELVAAFSDETCKGCHGKIYEQWKSTPHANSVNLALGGLGSFQTSGVKQWWKREVTKRDLMKCLDCHAPVMRFATEELAQKVGAMVLAAQETKDKREKDSIQKELARLNVGCVSCHNLKATTVAIGLRGEPEKDAVYGPRGKQSPAHKTVQSSEIETALFCMQCHGIHVAPDGEDIWCNTISGSYQDGYVARGGSRTCQDCHMKDRDLGHRILGGRDLELVKEGIGFNVEVSRYLHLPGKGEEKWTPSAIVSVGLENRAGHRIPDG